MKRGIAIFLLCAPMLFGQRSRPSAARPVAPVPPRELFFEVTVTDAEGRPVSGLAVENFQITQAGERQEIASLAWFDTRQHLAVRKIANAADAGATQPRFDIAPADIRRNIVLVVDDLGLTAERVAGVQDMLREFVEKQIGPDDRAAIVRTSSGASWQQELTRERVALNAQIGRIQPKGRGMSQVAVASAIWQSIVWTAGELGTLPGRKSVVLISDHLDSRVDPGAAAPLRRTAVRNAAHAAMMVLYTLDPKGSAPPEGSTLAWLVRETGGLSVRDLAAVLRDQEGFYVLGFHPAKDDMNWVPLIVELRGKVLSLRWRFGYVRRIERNSAIPLDRATAIQSHAATAGDIRTRVTPLFIGFGAQGANINVLVHIDARGLSDLRDLKGSHHLGVEIHVVLYSDSGRTIDSPAKGYHLTLSDGQYEKVREGGVVYGVPLNVPAPGGYGVRVTVADVLSDRVGTDMQFLEIPEVNKGFFGLSSLVLRGETSSPLPAETLNLERETAANRVFTPGAPIAFTYGIFNSTPGPGNESRLKVITRIYALGRLVYEGRPIELEYPASAGTVVRQARGKLQLDNMLAGGEYVLEVEVTDLLAKDAGPRVGVGVAVQHTTFEVQE